MAVTAEKIIRIDVVASANAQRTINAMATDMKKIESAATNMQRSVTTGFSGLNSILGKTAGFLGAFGITAGMGAVTRWVIESAQAYEVLESRLSLVLGAYDKAERATKTIADIAKTTGREIDGVAKLYEKAARSAQQFGISEDKVREITLGFSQSIRLSGASTQEAYASLVQFGQALASGRLQGDEFRSLMENNSVFMYEFAKAAGVTIAELRKMGTEGKLSAKLLFETMSKEGEDGLNMMERLNKMAASVPLTFSQSLNSVGSAMTEFLGNISKALSIKSDDKLGVFGPLIRSVTTLTEKIRELTIQSNALDEGFFKRMARLAGLAGSSLMGNGGTLGTAMSLFQYGADKAFGNNEPKTLTAKLEKDASEALQKVESMRKSVLDDENAFRRNFGSEKDAKGAAADVLKFLNERRSKLAELEAAYISVRKAQSDVSYGERWDGAEKAAATVTTDPDAERRLKSAKESLKDFLETKAREAEVSRRLVLGMEEEKKAAGDLLLLKQKLSEAGLTMNSAQGRAGEASIRQAERNRAILDELKEETKAREQLREAEKSDLEKVEAQLLKDNESIDALKNKTKATDELTEALLRQKRAAATEERFGLASQELPDSARLAWLNQYIETLDKAIAKKEELMGARADSRQEKEQAKIDSENTKRVDDLAEDLNRRLKAGILSNDGKSLGEALRDNIIEVVNNMTVDIIINPITSIFSRILAQLADDFSRMLTKSMYETISNNSSDSIGTLAGLLLSVGGGTSGSSGISGPGMKVPDTLLAPKLASGLSYVPYDEFPAVLHRGERVLTAKENASYNGSGVTLVSSPSIRVDSRTDQAEVYGIVAEAVRQGNQALVEEMRAQGILA